MTEKRKFNLQKRLYDIDLVLLSIPYL